MSAGRLALAWLQLPRLHTTKDPSALGCLTDAMPWGVRCSACED